MKILKRIIIWLVLMAAIVFVLNSVGVLILGKTILEDYERAYSGYSAKAEKFIHPVYTEPEEEGKNNGLSGLMVRAVFSNESFDTHKYKRQVFMFMDQIIDFSCIFFDENGTTGLSEGIFAAAYTDDGQSNAHYKNIVGLVDIKEFCRREESREVYKILDERDYVRIRLDSYSVDSDYVVHPAEYTLTDDSGTELGHYECPCDGGIVRSTDVYIYDDHDKLTGNSSMYLKMKEAYRGERSIDRTAKKLMSKADFSQSEQRYIKHSIGLASFTSRQVEVTDGGAAVVVIRFRFYRSVLLYTAIFGGIMTLIFILVCRKRDKRERNGY